jgi:pimeloyl-ACP methyl ester carboxylesterase
METAEARVDYDESGTGTTIVLVPGSCSTGAAWRPVISALGDGFRCVTTSLLGYGGTAERRTVHDASIAFEAEAVEEVVRRAGGRVHLVGHSFGGLVGLVVALRERVLLASLTVVEAPAAELLRSEGEEEHYRAFRKMTNAYFDAFEDGERQAISAMIDFYGGPGTFAAWPARVQAYAIDKTYVNILDWASGYGFPLTRQLLGRIEIPVLVLRGGNSHPAAQRANALVSASIPGAELATIEGAAHFMIATHAAQVAALIARHVHRAENIVAAVAL